MFGLGKRKSPKDVLVASPIKGKVIPIGEVEDEAFSSKAMGDGVAILPAEGKVYAPFDGSVAHIIEKSKHALVLQHQSGVQVLIHVGMNTVSLKGAGFTAHVQTGAKMKKGMLLLEFNMEQIEKAGYSVATPIIIPGGQEAVKEIEVLQGNHQDVTPDTDLLRIVM